MKVGVLKKLVIPFKRIGMAIVESPLISNEMRGRILGKKFKSCGKGLLIAPYVRIEWPQNLVCGDNVSFNRFCMISAYGGIEIGDNTLIGPFVVIYSSNHRFPRDRLIREAGYELKPVKIGSDVWIGAGAIILPGSTIGDGAVVGAGAVVSGRVEPYSVVAGVPAREIKKRS